MLQVQGLRKSYGAATILNPLSFVINRGERIGLIGPNGVGKSTLLRMIIGQEQPDAGVIVRTPPDLVIGYLPQSFETNLARTVGEVVTAAQAEFHAAEAAFERATEALSWVGSTEIPSSSADAPASFDEALGAYDEALARFEALGGYDRQRRAQLVLDGLGLGDVHPETALTTLSGGQKTRLGLATLLLGEPDLLLLDEPTNHLDVEALSWLEGFVREYPGAVLIVSHDREFLDQTATRIFYLDPEKRTIRSYPGSYSDFAEARQHEHELHAEAYKKQQEYIEKVETDIARLKGQALSVELTTTPAQPTIRRYAKKVAKKAKSRERKLERYLDSGDRVEKPRQRWGLKLDFGPPPPGGRAVLRVEDVSFSYDHGRTNGTQASQALPLLSEVTFDIEAGERVALVGPNGAGKTTLLRLIEGRLQPQSGTIRIGANVRLGILSQEHETLDPNRTVLETTLRERPMSETDARNFLHMFLFGGESVFRRIGICSLGERSRLQLALLVLRGCNLLLLDEPLNHLDIDGREHFEEALDAFEGTIIAVAHDRAFLHSFAERILEVRYGHVTSFIGDYEAYLAKRENT
jgi:ATP-binding cassette subfamily F protein 3